MNSMIIGASAGLGSSLARELAKKGHNLFLVSSDDLDLKPLAQDLALIYQVEVHYKATDLKSVDPLHLKKTYYNCFKTIDNLFIVAGLYRIADNCMDPEEALDSSIKVNFSSPVHIIEAFIEDFEQADSGNVVGIGSVAAIRARNVIPVYGACKRGLEFYFQAIRQRLAFSGCNVQFYRLGYVATQMNFGQKLPLPSISAKRAARGIIDGLNKDIGMKYLPSWWKYIALLYKLLPWFIFKRLKA